MYIYVMFQYSSIVFGLSLFFQVIDFWLLFFLITTALNIAVHIIIDHFHRKEKSVVETAVEKWKGHVRFFTNIID